ncbi:MAG: cell division protein ZapA [Candidatus Rokubacteria bacterium]|nr:cell division protein ZapA [Candidatus Rokubacteria bacterium]
MSKAARVEFELLGQRFTVRSEAPPEYVRELVAHVERTIGELKGEGGEDPVKLALLAALYITDELFRVREARSRETGDVAQRVGALVELLDKVAPPSALSA